MNTISAIASGLTIFIQALLRCHRARANRQKTTRSGVVTPEYARVLKALCSTDLGCIARLENSQTLTGTDGAVRRCSSESHTGAAVNDEGDEDARERKS